MFAPSSFAADIRANDTIIISSDEKNLTDLYLFGKSIEVGAPVTNDLVAAGGDIILDSSVSGSILAAGGNVRVKGDSRGSVRIAGGNIIIDGNVGRDLVTAGGSVIITKSSTVAGDLIVAGGEVTLDGNVNGKVLVQSGKARINGSVNKSVEGNLGKLTIGPDAVIKGDVRYSSPEKATISSGAEIAGRQQFTRIEDQKKTAEQIGGFFTAFSIYKLIGDIILSILFIYLLGSFLKPIISDIAKSPLINILSGFGFLILIPIISIFLMILLWLGIASFLFYFLALLVTLYIAKVFAGWIIVRWWYGRDNRKYDLDWKAGIVGPVVFFGIGFIPVIGWMAAAILYLIALGALIRRVVFAIADQQKQRPPQKKK